MNVAVRSLPEPQIAARQEREGRFCWAPCVEALLRKHGVVPTHSWMATLTVFPKGSLGSDDDPAGRCLIEGPLPAPVAARLDLGVEPRGAASVQLRAADRGRLGPLAYTAWRLRAKNPDTGAPGEPYEYQASDRRWATPSLEYQAIRPGPRWQPILFARSASDRPEEIVGVSDGARIVLGVPLLDVLGSLMAWPPFDDGYFGVLSPVVGPEVEEWLIEQLRDHVLRSGAAWAQLARWPDGAPWAHTVRHDYDRLITDTQMRDLLDAYARLGIQSTWYFLRNRCAGHQARILRARGHEVALHTTARSQEDFAAEIEVLERETDGQIRGATAHGGDAVGYLGSRDIAWSEAAGLSHGETIGRISALPFLAFRADEDVARPTSIVLTATHRSLDAGMGPHQHNLENLLELHERAARKGSHLVLMNHPDIHRHELLDVVTGADLTAAWKCTAADVARWTRAVKYGSSWSITEEAAALELCEGVPWPVVVHVDHPDGTSTTATAPPMARGVVAEVRACA